MITYQRLGKWVTAEPFRPFRINMASGQKMEIRHPEMISVGRSSATVYFSLSDDPEVVKEGMKEVSLMLMESIEPLDVAQPAGTNGQK